MEKTLIKLEREFGRYAVARTTEGLILLQVITYVLTYARPEIVQSLYLIPAFVLQGEVWRLFTFLAVPPVTNPIFAFFFWYIFYMMGTALEGHWGTFRYNIYVLIGFIATVALSFLTPASPATNAFLQGSVYLAFAFLYPDFQLYLFFILPVKIDLTLWADTVSKSPHSAIANYNLGTVYFKEKRWKEARVHYERAVRSDPQLVKAYFNLGLCQHFTDDDGRAIESLTLFVQKWRGSSEQKFAAEKLLKELSE